MSENAKETSINSKITDLNEKIAWFYSDDFSLDSALEKYETAVNLANSIRQDLNTLKNKVEVISKNFTS